MRITKIDESIANGWDLFYIPKGQKFPPPKGFTGAKSNPSSEELEAQANKVKSRDDSNIGIRIPEGVVGVDIDDESTSSGRLIQASTGNSFRVTSTDGIRRYTAFYRLPEGVTVDSLKNVDGVDLITRFHRYSVLGIHPSGRDYRLLDPKGNEIDSLPPLNELELLPDDVFNEMKRGPYEKKRASTTSKVKSNKTSIKIEVESNLYIHEVEDKDSFSDLVFDDIDPCFEAREAFSVGIELVKFYWSAHTATLKALKALEGVNKRGHSVGTLPLDIIGAFVDRVGEDRRDEAERMAEGLDFKSSMCDCNQREIDEIYIDPSLLEQSGLDKEEVLTEVWIRTQGKVFPSVNHRLSFEKITARNFLLNKISVLNNKRKAERAFSDNHVKVSNSFEVMNVMNVVEALSKSEDEKKILFMIAYGEPMKDISAEMGKKGTEIYYALGKIRKRNRRD